MRHLSTTVALCLIVFSPPATTEEILTPEVEEIARQAPLIVKGRVLSDLRFQVQKQYKGQVRDETISIADLSHFNDLVKEQWEEADYALERLRSKIGHRAWERFEEKGLVGSTLIVFLEKTQEREGYNLKARTLRFPKGNYKHAAIKVLSDNVVLGFSQVTNPGPLWLLVDWPNSTIERLESSIRYDHPLFFRFGFASATGGKKVYNYFYFSLMNLSDKPVPVQLDRNMKLTVKGHSMREETELPNAFWTPKDLPAVLSSGQRFVGHYELTRPELGAFDFKRGKEYQGTLAIRIGKGEAEDVYSGEAEARIR